MIFNDEMVRAILNNRKTQTRRIMRNQPAGDTPETPVMIRNKNGAFQWYDDRYGESGFFPCPFGQQGDRIWVRETYRVHSKATDVATLVYRASVRNSWTEQTHRVPVYVCNKQVSPEKWTPSIHMPRWASRILLEITDVRVERLQDISDEDARAEGCWRGRGFGRPDLAVSLCDEFPTLWASVYGEENWLANPWVWVIEFKRIQEATSEQENRQLAPIKVDCYVEAD